MTAPADLRPASGLPNFLRRRAAAARTLAVVCLLAALPVAVAPFFATGRLASFRLAAVCGAIVMLLSVAVASLAVSRRQRRDAVRLDHALARLNAGQFMVRWTYSPALWRAWSSAAAHRDPIPAGAPTVVPALAAAAALVVAAGAERDARAAMETALAALLAAACVGGFRRAVHALRIRRQSPGVRECFIANDMLYFDEQAFFFSSHESRLATIDYQAGDIPEVRLRIVLLDRDGDDVRTMTLRIPVPPRGGSAARRVTTRLRRRFDPSSVHLTGRHPHHKLIHRNPPPAAYRRSDESTATD